jgi:pimeloyl-ACP methyl ester carboxylesterase
MTEELQVRCHGDPSLPTLVYLPGLHGDWTLVTRFRLCIAGKVRFVEITFPRTLTWSLESYARAVDEVLVVRGIHHGWLLAESFGSQVAWAMIGLERPGFRPQGVVLAGGFVRHPLLWGVRLAVRVGQDIPLVLLVRLLLGYAKLMRNRRRDAPETVASLEEFVARRTELDRRAAVHRLRLILENDLRPIARSTASPVFALTGFWDPVVPWPLALRWFKKNVPGLRGTRVVFSADHNILSTAPAQSAKQVLLWMNQNRGVPASERGAGPPMAVNPRQGVPGEAP